MYIPTIWHCLKIGCCWLARITGEERESLGTTWEPESLQGSQEKKGKAWEPPGNLEACKDHRRREGKPGNHLGTREAWEPRRKDKEHFYDINKYKKLHNEIIY